MTHELKILPQYFEDVANGKKNFELRKNDRNYQVGDILLLREWRPANYPSSDYTGRYVVRIIEYVFKGGAYGLSKEYCILGIKQPENDDIISDSTKNAIDDAYQRGLNAAWECARKIINNDVPWEEWNLRIGQSTDTVFDNYSASEALQKIKEYEEKQKADDEIKVGDEVLNKWGTKGIVIEIAPQHNGSTIYSVFWRNAERKCLDKSDWEDNKVWKKTGRHFSQIIEVLEQMKGVKDESKRFDD